MDKYTIVTLIKLYSGLLGFDANVAVSVARVESSLNPNAIGSMGEIGLYQLMPQFVKEIPKDMLYDPHVNIIVGIQRLKEAKEKCIHKDGINFLVCYNYGMTNAKKVKNPHLFPYVKKVNKELAKTSSNRSICVIN